MRKFIVILSTIVVIIAIGGCIAIGANTLGPLMIPCIVVAVVTAVCSVFMRRLWQKLSRTSNRWINMGISVIVMFPILMCTVLAVNYFGSDDASLQTENAVIQRLYSKTRHHTKRVSRRTVGVGEAYKVYYAEVDMAGATGKEISLNLKQWQRLHKGDTIKLQVARGALGMRVIKRRGVPVEVPRSRYRF